MDTVAGKRVATPISLLALALLGGCASQATAQSPSVQADIIDSEGRRIGSALISEAENGVRFELEVSGLDQGAHGLHIHGKGACDPPDFQTAGSHFAPQQRSHGFLDSAGPHAGDLPALHANSDGVVEGYGFTSTRVMLDDSSLLDSDGSSLVIHERPDDYLTDGGGGTGPRIACAVISPSGLAQRDASELPAVAEAGGEADHAEARHPEP